MKRPTRTKCEFCHMEFETSRNARYCSIHRSARERTHGYCALTRSERDVAIKQVLRLYGRKPKEWQKS